MDCGEETLEGDRFGGTFLLAQSAPDARHLTVLHGQGAFVFIGTVYIYKLLARMYLPHLRNGPGARLEAFSATCAFIYVYSGILFTLRICHGSERTGHYTVTQPETAEIAG